MIVLLPLLLIGVLLLLRVDPAPLPASFARVPLLGRFAPLPAMATVRGPLVWRATEVRRSMRPIDQILAVGRLEARQIVRHPLVIFANAVHVLRLGVEFFEGVDPSNDLAQERYAELIGGFTVQLYLGMLGFLGVHLVASRQRRTHLTEQLVGTPMTDTVRTLGTLLGASVIGLMALIQQLALWASIEIRDAPVLATPTVIQMLAAPAACLGGAMLAVMVARWLPWWPAALAVIFGLGFVTAAGEAWDIRLLVSYVDPYDGDTGTFASLGWGWHVAYLLGLSSMAGVGALLRGRVRDVRLLACGAAAIGFTVAAGVLQYP